MSDKRVPLGVLMASALVLAGVVGWGVVGRSQAAPPGQSPEAKGITVPYAGQLSEAQGEPVADGAYDLAFALYATQTGGTVLWQETQTRVATRGGSFRVQLGSVTAIPEDVLAGDGGWLAVAVRGAEEEDFTTLAPRQRVSAAAVASSEVSATAGLTCPHDHWGETWTGSGVLGLIVRSTQFGVMGSNTPAGNWGVLGGPEYGVEAQAYCEDCDGVFARSDKGHGVYGWTFGAWNYRSGVFGRADNDHANGVTGWHTAKGPGVYAYSKTGSVLVAKGDSGNLIEAWDNNPNEQRFRVENDGDVYADGQYYSGGTDYADMVAVAGDTAQYEPGDVLAIGPEGMLVLANTPHTTKVAGVYSTQPGFLGGDDGEGSAGGKIPLALVGVVPVKASAENGPIAPGDLLVASATPGHAMKAGASPPIGSVIGKAFEGLDEGTGVISILVTLQ